MLIIEILKSIVFGIVEGVTEWLPISSTGHLILLDRILPLTVGDNPDAFLEMYDVVIQLGAIMAVVIIYWNKLWPFGKKKNRYPLARTGAGRWVKKDIFALWFHILVSCIPAAIVGVLFDDQINALFYNYMCVSLALIIVGMAFLIVETYYEGRDAEITKVSAITYKTAFWIGMFQLIAAIFPGTSRSGATIIGALLLGVSRGAAAEYTFFLAVPVMFGASLLKFVKIVVVDGLALGAGEIAVLLVGCIVAFVVSVFCIKFLLSYIRRHNFKIFAWYRIILGIVVLACGLMHVI